MPDMPDNLVCLRAAPAADIVVDRAAGIIRGVAVMTAGPARGHGFQGELDGTSLASLMAVAGKVANLKTRLGHAELEGSDGLAVTVGEPRNFRRDGDKVRADIHLFKSASNMPGLGDVRTWLMDRAEEAPHTFGMSIVGRISGSAMQSSNGTIRNVGRIENLIAVDFVGNPAANPSGLLSQPTEGKDNMPEDTITDPTPTTPLTGTPTIDAAALAERKRIQYLTTAHERDFPGMLSAEFRQKHVDAGTSPEAFARAALDEIARQAKPIEGMRITSGEDSRDSLADAMSDAICMNWGTNLDKPHKRAEQFRGLTVGGAADEYLSALGVRTRGMSKAQRARLVFDRGAMARAGASDTMLSHSTSDFPLLLANSMNKRARRSYEEAGQTWRLWAAPATAADFREIKRPILSTFPTPPAVAEGAEYTHVTIGEASEVYTLAKYGAMIRLTWEMLVNDDTGAFSAMSRALGQAAARLEDDVAYLPLTSNQTMTEDSVALFNSGHNNYTASGTVISVTSLGVARALLAVQKSVPPQTVGPNTVGHTLNLRASVLLVPPQLQTLAEQLTASLVDPAKNNAAVNPFAGLRVVGEPRLGTDSVTAWYLVADRGQIDTVEVCFLQGYEAPLVEMEEGFNTDTRNYKLRHCVAGRAIDYRGLYKNVGA